jgi:hypothetical protein
MGLKEAGVIGLVAAQLSSGMAGEQPKNFVEEFVGDNIEHLAEMYEEKEKRDDEIEAAADVENEPDIGDGSDGSPEGVEYPDGWEYSEGEDAPESEDNPTWENGDFSDMKQREWAADASGELVVDEDGNAEITDEYSEAADSLHENNVEFVQDWNSAVGDTSEIMDALGIEGAVDVSDLADAVNASPELLESETEIFEGIGQSMVDSSGQTTDTDRFQMQQENFLESTAVDLEDYSDIQEPAEISNIYGESTNERIEPPPPPEPPEIR